MDGTDGSDGSAPDVYPKAEAVDSKPFLSTGDNHVLQIQFREKQNHVVKSSIRKGPHYYRKRAVPIPQTTKAPMLFFFSFLFINFFFFFFLRLEVNPLRHMVSELVQSPLLTYTNGDRPVEYQFVRVPIDLAK